MTSSSQPSQFTGTGVVPQENGLQPHTTAVAGAQDTFDFSYDGGLPSWNLCIFGPSTAAAPFTTPLFTQLSGTVPTASPDIADANSAWTPTTGGVYCAYVQYTDTHGAGTANRKRYDCFTVKATPTISTTPANATQPGTVSDGAQLANFVAPLTSTGTVGGTADTVTFSLFGPSSAASCVPGDLVTTVSPSLNPTTGAATSGALAVPLAGDYWWTVSFAGDPNNVGVSSPCSAEESVVSKASPSIVTTPANVTLPGTVSDGAQLNNFAAPLTNTGLAGGTADTVTFSLFGPSPAASCISSGAGKDLVSTVSSSLNKTTGAANSGAVTPPSAGNYWWTVSYGGDPNNMSVSSGCGAEESVVSPAFTKASPTITTTPTNLTLPGTISDGAQLGSFGPLFPGDTMTFSLFGPSPTPSCVAGDLVTTVSPSVNIVTGASNSGALAVTKAGDYWWTVTFAGDLFNNGVNSPCGAEESVVKAQPTITTTPTNLTLPGTVSDGAQLANFAAPLTSTGAVGGTADTITFSLFGPSAVPSCVVGDLVGTVSPSLNPTTGAANSGPVSGVTMAGDYWWTVTYGGDPNNLGVSSACGAEESVASPAQPTITTTPSDLTLPGTISDGAQLGSFIAPLTNNGLVGGTADTVTFSLFGPSPTAICIVRGAGHDLVTSVSPSLDPTAGTANSGPLAVSTPGNYWWTVSYGGDPNNLSVSSPCSAEESVVSAAAVGGGGVPFVPASPTITTSASPTSGVAGVTLTNVGDTATFQNANNPTGSVTFTLYSNSACTAAVSGMSGSGTISNSGGTSTASFTAATWTPPAAGVYYWQASYGGDPNNNKFTTSCDALNEEITVTPPISAAADPSLTASKNSTPAPGSTVSPGQTVTYAITLTNVGNAVASLVTVTDNIPAGTTYLANSATCGGVPTCAVSLANGLLTWTGIDVPALAGGAAGVVTVSYQVTVNSNVTNGQVIPNFALFTNEFTPSCTTTTCSTNTVDLTAAVTAPPTAPASSPPITAATTVHTGEPWAGSRILEILVGLFGMELLAMGLLRRRQYRALRSESRS